MLLTRMLSTVKIDGTGQPIEVVEIGKGPLLTAALFLGKIERN